jgi:hypothetical protein
MNIPVDAPQTALCSQQVFTKAGSSNFAATGRLSAGVVRSVPCPEPEAVYGRMTAARFFFTSMRPREHD